MNSRRQFLIKAPLGLAGVLAACQGDEHAVAGGKVAETPGAPPAFNTAPPVGPEVSPATFAEAEKLMQVTMTDAQRQMATNSWRTSMAALFERRTGPRKLALEPELAPATHWTPGMSGEPMGPSADHFVRTTAAGDPLPASDDAIAYATVSRLSRWIESKQLTSDRLTRIYLDRIARFDPKLRCVSP